MNRINFANSFETTIAGIPCLIEVRDFLNVPPNPSCMDSDMDHNGYCEVDWAVFDRKGYRAKWLERKLDDDCRSRIEEQAIAFCNDGVDSEPEFEFDDCPY